METEGNVSRRSFLKCSGFLTLALGTGAFGAETLSNKRPANILFLCIDDLNNWVGCMNGHPDVKTPNIDKLAASGTLFMNAHCAAPLCAPSRTALLSGRAPYKTGVYKNRNKLRDSSILNDTLLLPRNFKNNGYYVAGTGKIFHEGDQEAQCWSEYWPALDRPNPDTYLPPREAMPLHGMPVPESAWGNDWGSLPVDNEQMGDWKTAGWVGDKLKSGKMREPFFLAWGCKLPHVPLYAPKKYFDMYPIDKISMPIIKEDDLDDVPEAGRLIGSRNWPWKPHEYIKKYDKAKSCVQAYLACVSFVDDCVGRVLDAFEASEYKDNTVVVFVSDHGMHKGEKDNWSKYTLWEEATNVPLIFAGEGVKSGKVCREPVNLLDFYPTFIEMCGLSDVESLDGRSIMPLLENPDKDFGRVSVTTYGPNLNSVRSRDWRYIRYADGSEELYNHREDTYEWHNLASIAEHKKLKEKLSAYIPSSQCKPARGETEKK